ncbi:MAG: hypothetical protein ABI193_23620, partial [Minicystis sp.]
MNLKIPLRAAWVLPILVTGLSIGCVGADSADLDDGPTSAVEQAFSACVNPVTYADSAAVGTIQCSSTYTVSAGAPMDDCVNAVSPPLPSVLRNYVAPYNPAHFTTNGNSGAIAFPYGPWDLTQPTLLPTFRTSNDGRLTLLEGGAFGVFLPENVEYDLMPNASPARRSVGAASYRFHPFHFFNPLDTQLAVAAAPAATPQKFHIVQVPEAGHSNLCDDSSSGFDPGVLPQISDKRNPRPCSATFRNNSHEIFGDCYDITLQTNTSLCTNPQASVYACSPLPAHVAFCDSVGYAQKSPFCPSVQWEIRSNDLTVFVPAARGVAAGSWDFLPSEWTLPGDNLLSTAGAPVWVYPRQPANVSLLPAWDGDGTPNTTYNPHQSNWDQNYSEAQRCYVNGVAPTHAANALRWCELLWSQKHTPATGFLVDGDGNASDNP